MRLLADSLDRQCVSAADNMNIDCLIPNDPNNQQKLVTRILCSTFSTQNKSDSHINSCLSIKVSLPSCKF